jgi:hypothetical protein
MWSRMTSSNFWSAGMEPRAHEVPCASGQSVKRGVFTWSEFTATVAVTLSVATVLQSQIEYVIVPPGDTWDSCLTICAVRQTAPAGGDLLGDGLGDGLGEPDPPEPPDGPGLLSAGLGLADGAGLSEGPAL